VDIPVLFAGVVVAGEFRVKCEGGCFGKRQGIGRLDDVRRLGGIERVLSDCRYGRKMIGAAFISLGDVVYMNWRR